MTYGPSEVHAPVRTNNALHPYLKLTSGTSGGGVVASSHMSTSMLLAVPEFARLQWRAPLAGKKLPCHLGSRPGRRICPAVFPSLLPSERTYVIYPLSFVC